MPILSPENQQKLRIVMAELRLSGRYRLSVLNLRALYKENCFMRKTMISLIFAAVMLSGCATLSDTADSACNSVVLNRLCGDS